MSSVRRMAVGATVEGGPVELLDNGIRGGDSAPWLHSLTCPPAKNLRVSVARFIRSPKHGTKCAPRGAHSLAPEFLSPVWDCRMGMPPNAPDQFTLLYCFRGARSRWICNGTRFLECAHRADAGEAGFQFCNS